MSQGRKRVTLFWLTAALSVSALVSITALAITWSTQTWELDNAAQYQVSDSQKIQFFAGPPTVARLELNTMPDHIENTNATFSGTRSNLVWPNPPNNHLELPSTAVPRELDATASNVLALWRFNEASGTTVRDTTGSSTNFIANDGTTTNPSPTRSPGLLSNAFGSLTNALQFDAGNYVIVGDQPELKPTAAISVAAWVNFTNTAGNQPIVYKGMPINAFCTPCFPTYQLSKTDTNQFTFATGVLGSFGIQYPNTVTSVIAGGVQPNTWYYVVGTYNHSPQQLSIYVNGALSRSGPDSGFFYSGTFGNYNTNPLLLGRGGCQDTVCGGALNGLVDEVALYNTALPAGTISANYTTTVKQFNPRMGSYTSPVIDAGPLVSQWRSLEWSEGPTPTGAGLGEEIWASSPNLVSLWHFNQSAADSKTSSSNNGTLVGSPVWTTGKFKDGLYLDGSDDRVDVTELTPLSMGQITIEAWVRFDQLNWGASIFNRRNSSNVGGVTLELGNGNDLGFYAYIGGAWRFLSSGVDSLTTGQWYHLAATYDGFWMRLYINGVQTGTLTFILGSINNPAGALVRIGQNIAGGQFLKGTVDEVAIYDRALPATGATANDILTHYRQGSVNLRFQGRSGPSATPDATWSPWQPADGAPISNLTYGLLGLWHLDGDWVDTTGGPTNTTANTLSPSAPTISFTTGKFGSAASFPATQSASVATPMTQTDNWTLEAWVYDPGGIIETGLVYNGTSGDGYGLWRGDGVTGSRRISIRYGFLTFITTSFYDQNAWTHVVAVRERGILKLYKNGQQISSGDLDGAVSPAVPTGSLTIRSVATGRLDEVAIYNVALDEHTILDHYLGQAFTVSPAQSTTSIVPDNRYLQFRTFFSSDKLALSPELSSATVKAQNYPTDNPTVINTGVKPTYTLLNSFAETRGPAAGQGQLRYQLSPNGASWYWHNGTNWVLDTAASDLIESDPASELTQAVIATFPQQVGTGNLQWKAILVSDGSQPVELDKLAVEYADSTFTLTAPATGATWLVGKPYTITWNKTGTIANVKLEYAPDGVAFQEIDPGVTKANGANPGCTAGVNQGCYAWTLPAALAVSPNSNPGQGVSKLRISGADVGAESVTDDSDPFTVTRLNLTKPDTTDTWLVGNTYTVTWDTTTTTTGAGAVTDVILEYAADGTTFSPIATVPNTGSYLWTIPANAAVSPNSNPGQGVSKLRITVPGAPTVTNTSQNFTVTKFTVTAPLLNDQWRLGKTHTVTWQASATGLNQVTIEYSSDNGTTWKIVTPSAAHDPLAPSYSWNLPGNDLSFLSCDVATPLVCPSPSGLIRVTVIDPPGLGVLANTSAKFSVTKPFVRIIEPHAGEVLGVGTVKDIVWDKEGPIGTNLKIEYSTNSFADETQTVIIVNGDNGGTSPITSPYSWVVPGAAASPTVKIRIIDLNLPEGNGKSEQFKVAGSINIAVPVAGLKWAVGKPHSIQWTNTGQITNVKIELSKDGGLSFPTVIAASVPNGLGGGTFSWTPAPADASANAVIRVSDAADYDVKRDSAAFLVTNATITNPVGGERWLVGASKTLTWTHTGLTNVRLDYSTDNGATFPNLIAASVPAASGSLAWTVPDTIKKDTVKIRIRDADATGESQAEGLSNGFTIHGQLNITAPTDTDVWNSGQPHTITWTTPVGMTIPNVKLEYSVDNFTCSPTTNCGVIAASTPNTGSYSWTPDFTAGDIVKVRVSDAQDPQTLSTSGFFEVPGIAMQVPAGSEVWPVGSSQTIRWSSTGSFTHVKLEYSTDNFVTPILIQDNVLNTGNFVWNPVPDTISTAARVRVTPTTDATLFSTSNPFTITGVLTIASPGEAAGQVFDAGSDVPITWTTVGTIPTVSLEYSTDGGAGWLPVLNGAGNPATNIANTNSFTWRVPATISTQVRVRVKDAVAGHPATSDASDNLFTIRAAFGFVEPTGTSAWGVYQSPSQPDPIPPITWTTQGNVSQIRLEYSTDDFATATLIGVVSNTGSYNWTVPDLISPMILGAGGTPGNGALNHTRPVKIRIADADAGHPAASATSAAFTVKWFKVTFEILDEDNLQQLNGLSVSDRNLDPAAPHWAWLVEDNSLNPAIYHHYAYGNYETTWWNANYFTKSASWTGNRDATATASYDKKVSVRLLSKLAEQVPYQVRVEYAYEPSTDTLKFKTWLEKRGLLVGTTASDLANLGQGKVEVYSGTTLLTTLTQAAADANGTYDMTWSPTGLAAGNVYFAKASVVFPISATSPPGTWRTSGGGVNVSIPKQIEAINVNSTGVTLGELQTELAPIKTETVGPTSKLTEIHTETVGPASTLGQAAATVGTLPGQITAAQGAIQADVAGVDAKVTTLQGTADAIQAETDLISTQVIPGITNVATKVDGVQAYLSDPNAGLPKVLANQDAAMLQLKAQRRGGLLNRDMELETGETATLQYRSEGGVPSLNVYDGTGVVVPGLPPLSLNPATGLYESSFSLAALGEYRAVVTEPASADSAGTVDSIVLTVRAPVATAQDVGTITTKLDSLSTQLAAVELNLTGQLTTIQNAMATKTQADAIYADTQALRTKWGTLDAAALMTELNSLSVQVGAPAQAADMQSALTQLGTLQADLTALTATVNDPAQKNRLETAITMLQQIQTDMPVGGADLSAINSQLTTIQSTLDAVPTGDVDLTSIATQLTSVEETVNALQSEQTDTGSLMAKLEELDKAVQSAQGSSAAVGLSQGAFSAAKESLTILQQLQTEIRTNTIKSPAAPIFLGKFGEKMQEISEALTVIPGKLDVETLNAQLSQLAERLKTVSTEKGYHFDSLYQMTEAQRGDVKTVRNRVEELKVLVEIQRDILEHKLNEPVVKTWFEAGY